MLQLILNKILPIANVAPILRALAGKTVKVEVLAPTNYVTFITFEENQALLNSAIANEPDLVIQGRLQDFVHFSIFKDRKVLQIQGDPVIANLIAKLYLEMDIDWEEELAKHTNDSTAHVASYWLQRFKATAKTNISDFSAMCVEYMQEESPTLPTPSEVEQFMQEVDELRLRVDRLEARIKAYATN